ncbi:hypothetical protein IMZ08_04750 [Bacillus luteolus]|uniref:Spore coat protein n=1 Tax=Litchfieldia luteola TaxID=682179 RepID=A0ABR9QFU8_9BACI|nr:hypothetical protein [Cytobacillus luteolus]MBE4907370.1 hypothetical protein [Cytobacillus luteolus]MBP1944135.1 hypothetical protein [Cytobacillus luteolus]
MQQQQNVNQNQQVMSQAPNVITTKDLLYLSDMMSWNLMALKKAHFLAGQCQIPELSQALDKAGQMHQRHYEKILGHLQNTNQPTQGMMQQQQQQNQQQNQQMQ